MTVTLYSMHYIRRTHHMLKRTLLNGPHAQPLMQDAETGAYHPVYDHPEQVSHHCPVPPDGWVLVRPYVWACAARCGYTCDTAELQLPDVCPICSVLKDIDDWYSSDIEDDGFLEQLDRSAESVHFP